jgi:hypothetical protein
MLHAGHIMHIACQLLLVLLLLLLLSLCLLLASSIRSR